MSRWRQVAKWSVQASIAEQVAAGLGRRECADASGRCPCQRHRLAPPFGLGFLAPEQFRGEPVVAFAEHSAHTSIAFAGNAFDRIAAAVDAREDILDAGIAARWDRSAPTWGGC